MLPKELKVEVTIILIKVIAIVNNGSVESEPSRSELREGRTSEFLANSKEISSSKIGTLQWCSMCNCLKRGFHEGGALDGWYKGTNLALDL